MADFFNSSLTKTCAGLLYIRLAFVVVGSLQSYRLYSTFANCQRNSALSYLFTNKHAVWSPSILSLVRPWNRPRITNALTSSFLIDT
jgi:hypothetical protein